jgi:hypothetical protein
MAYLTKAMERELDDLLNAACAGLPASLKSFIEMSVLNLRSRCNWKPDAYTRAELQAYIDTLIDLIDTKVNSR